MDTLIIAIVLVILFVITWIVIAVSGTSELSKCCLDCLHTHNHNPLTLSNPCCDHYGVDTLRKRVERVEEEKKLYDKLYYEFRMREMEANGTRHPRPMSSTDQEKFAKKLDDAMIPLEDLKKELK